MVRLPLVKLERDGLGPVVGQVVNVATPPDTVAAVVPWSGPVPLASVAVTTVLLSPVSRLPYWSSSSTTGWWRTPARPSPSPTAGCGSPTGWPPPG